MKDIMRLGNLAILAICSWSIDLAFAQDDNFDVSELKQKVSEMQTGRQSYSVIEADLEKTNKQLMDAESALLKQAESESLEEKDGVKKALEVKKVDAPTPKLQAVSNPAKSPGGNEKELARAAIENIKPAEESANKIVKINLETSQALKDRERTIQKLNAEKNALERKLGGNSSKVERLVNELTETKSKLMLAETEVERLSQLLNQYTKEGLSHYAKINLKDSSPAPAPKKIAAKVSEPQRVIEPDMLVATVMSDKAFLRTGPGKDNSPLMTVKKGTRLAVETRDGAWLRVIAPTGTRAWVDTEVVAFGANGQNTPTDTVEIKAYGGNSSESEDAAFKLINSSLAK